jgi:glyoxylase-like metal-dependent hydrolase (beta-lactamase superfamily II)
MPEKIRNNIYRIAVTLPGSPLKVVNSYLIMGLPRNLLIDTGFNHPASERDMDAALAGLHVDLDRTDILLTHIHSDHSGLVGRIARPKTRVFCPKNELARIRGTERGHLWQLDIDRMRSLGYPEELLSDQETFSTSRAMAPDGDFTRYSPLSNGDTFPCGGHVVRAVEAPGHTPDHMCFYMEDQRILFTGDCVLFDITPNITAWREMEDALGTYMDSLRMLDSLPVDLALPGHRTPGDFHTRIADLLLHHQHRLEEAYQVVKQNPGATVYELSSRMTWKMRNNSWAAFPPYQKWFAVGEGHSHLQHLEKLGRIGRVADELVRYQVV